MSLLQSLISRIRSRLTQASPRSLGGPPGSRYIVVDESIDGFTLPDEQRNERRIGSIKAPGVDATSSAVVLYRTSHTGHPSFQATLNGRDLTHRTFSDNDPHSWHRVVPPGTLQHEGNELTFAVVDEGTVTFSDIVILYTAN